MIDNRIRALVSVTLVAALTACGSGAGGDTTTTGAETTTTSTATTVATTSTPSPTSTSQPGTTTTSDAPTTTQGLPGEPIDFGPAEGDVLGVIGVRHDDVLNLRAAPGTDQVIVDEIPPLYDDLVAAGATRELPRSLWILVDYEGTEGWVSLAFVAYLGATSDETAAVIAELGERPTADTMTGLGSLVAGTMASDEPPSDIVMVDAPTVGDLGEVVFDVVGIGDDAVRGFRLHVFGDPVDGAFTLRSVETTVLCGRGVTADGLCV